MTQHKYSLSIIPAALTASLCLAGCNQPTQESGEAASDSAEPAELTETLKQGHTAVDGSSEAPDAQDEATATDGAAHKKALGAILSHLPEDCSRMRLYVNLERFGRYPETGNLIAGVASKALAQTAADEKYVAPVFEMLRKEGLSFVEDVDEVAACADNRKEWVALVSMDLRHVRAKPDELLTKALAEVGQKDTELKKEADVSYVLVPKSSGGALGFIAPGILGFASSPSTLALAAASHTGGMSVSDSQSELATLQFPAGAGQGRLTLTGDEKNLTASLFLPLNAKEQAKLRKDVSRYLTLLKGVADARFDDERLARVNVTSIERFLGDFDRLDVSISKSELSAKITVSALQIQQAVAALAEIKPSSFQALAAGLD